MPNSNPAKRIGMWIAWMMMILNIDALVIHDEIKNGGFVTSFMLVMIIPAMMGLFGTFIVEEVYQHSAAVTRERVPDAVSSPSEGSGPGVQPDSGQTS